jgi:P-type E1-E2 ATPase
MWKDIHCGDIVRVNQDEFIPCDLVILSSSDAKGVAYVETKNLDGETNLKMKQA